MENNLNSLKMLKEILDAEEVIVQTDDNISIRTKQVDLKCEVSFKVEVNGEEMSGGGNIGGSGYIHPETHPYSMLTGAPTKLSNFVNDIGVGGGGGTITTTNTLDQYSGGTFNEKMVNMFNDLNTESKRYLPMEILLPSGIIEVTQDLRAIKWKNKVFRCSGTIVFKNCNAIEFVQCQHNDIFINRAASVAPDNVTGSGLIDPGAVNGLTKRGIKLTDFSYNNIRINTIVGFTNAIELYSEYGALGTFYNNIYFTDIWRCQRPMVFKTGKASDDTARQSGWITEIFVHGGKFDCEDGILIGQEVSNRPQNEPTDNYQGIKFYNVGVEHVRKKEKGVGIYFLQGKSNAVINPRFEGSLKAGNPTSGAYLLVKESGYACLNKIETSNYPINIDRVQLNFAAMQVENPNYHNYAGSYITGCLMDNSDNRLGFKATATPGKMIYESHNMNSYFFTGLKNNTFIYTYTDTEMGKFKTSTGAIKTIAYTS